MNLVTVCEHARLTIEACDPSLALARVPESAFQHICRLSEQVGTTGARLSVLDGETRLALDSYVGIIQTPCGTTVEILPKSMAAEPAGAEAKCRALLRKLIQSFFDLPPREAGEAHLETFDVPLSEWVMAQFLFSLDRLIRRGLRSDFSRIEETQPYLRGQHNVSAQMRQPPGREHLFDIRHDVFTPDRAENRLLRAALALVRDATLDGDTWRLAQELSERLDEIPFSVDLAGDFRAWRSDRLMAHYAEVRPWCEIILLHAMPVALQGSRQGISLLFPMEKLFERHVAAVLRRQAVFGTRFRTPARTEFLCQHDGGRIFRLEPDMLVEGEGGAAWVLDTKWKLLDTAARANKYGLDQGDFYQLYAYGQRYVRGRGSLALVYPRSSRFGAPLPAFHFDEGMTLYVLPFDLETDSLLGTELLGLPLRSRA